MARTQVGKRERLVTAAARVLYEQGVEKTTIADIARTAEVPVGNVYYYFKTKDQLVEAAMEEQARALRTMTDAFEGFATPQERLKALLGGWAEQREQAARFGCPTGSMSSELGKRDDGLHRSAATVMGLLVEWVERQFTLMGRADARELAVSLVASYQGISLLTNVFADPELMAAQLRRLEDWIDGLDAAEGA
ncbi:TetR/AcrR family transcriptional regulator [Phytomonospora sp. NPDC050363]|uniref:TetR/AcrR family transcriptional regulator n=1 Tax=Phytomonospora sp. NPDC050363 TaxID=3155642 RepID=UPI0033ED8153